MSQRVFIALKISPSLQKKILEWEERFQDLPVRWLQGKNLHITLIPPWYTQDTETLKKLLLKVQSRFGSIPLSFDTISLGADPREPRLIWAEGKTPAKILDLKKLLEELIGREAQNRKFKLHLTLARFRPENFHDFPLKKLDEKISWAENVDTLVLMESHLSPQGADYEILTEITL